MKATRYDRYRFSVSEWVRYVSIWAGITGAVSYLFYRSIYVFPVMFCSLPMYLKRKKQDLCKQRKKELNLQFREAILSVSASLGAGYSMENAFLEAKKDLEKFYPQGSAILEEFSVLEGRLGANDTLEEILQDFARRSMVQDIQDFTDVFVTAKRSGGDMTAIIRRTADQIGDKIEVLREIDTLMSAKKLEQKIMNAIPFGIIFYVSINSPGFLDSLYHNVAGAVIMTGCLAAYLGAFLLSERIMGIEV